MDMERVGGEVNMIKIQSKILNEQIFYKKLSPLTKENNKNGNQNKHVCSINYQKYLLWYQIYDYYKCMII